MAKKKIEIKLDPNNARFHNDQNKDLINKSLDELGAGRSIVIDNDDTIIGGNGVFEEWQEMGKPVKVVESDGSELIVVKRTDLSYEDEKRKALAIADNSTSDLSYFDEEALDGEYYKDIDIDEWKGDYPEDDNGGLDGDENQRSSAVKYLKIGKYQIVITEEECNDLLQIAENYVEQHSIATGFGNFLVNCVKKAEDK